MKKNIFRPGSFLEHLGEPKVNQFLSYNRPLKRQKRMFLPHYMFQTQFFLKQPCTAAFQKVF